MYDEERLHGKESPYAASCHHTLLYLIGPGEDGPCKIGISCNVKMRLSALQSGCWVPLRLFRVFSVIERGARHNREDISLKTAAQKLEREILKKAVDLEVRLSGEWVDVTVEEAEKFIRKVAEKSKCGAVSTADLANLDLAGRPDAEMHGMKEKLLGGMLIAERGC